MSSTPCTTFDARPSAERLLQEASARDAFIEGAAQAGSFASRPTPDDGSAAYFRDEVRNDVAHIIRDEGKKQVNPDAQSIGSRPLAGLAGRRQDAARQVGAGAGLILLRWRNLFP